MKRSRAAGQSTALRRAGTRQWVLKPQDLVVALKLVTLQGAWTSYAALAKQLQLSPFEGHAAAQRLMVARLAAERDGVVRPNLAALRLFTIHGAPYAYPPVRGEATIGFPTAHGAAPLKGKVRSAKDSCRYGLIRKVILAAKRYCPCTTSCRWPRVKIQACMNYLRSSTRCESVKLANATSLAASSKNACSDSSFQFRQSERCDVGDRRACAG